MQSKLVPYPCMSRVSKSTASETPQRSHEPYPIQELPSLGFQSGEEEFPQNLLKSVGILVVPVRQKEPKKPDIPLKGAMYRLTHSQTCTLGSVRKSAAWEAQETQGERLNCMVLGQEVEGTAIIVLLLASLQGSLQMGTLLPVFTPLTDG